MLGQNVQYDFNPSDEDEVGRITVIDETNREQLEAEAKKHVQKITKEVKVKGFINVGTVYCILKFIFIMDWVGIGQSDV